MFLSKKHKFIFIHIPKNAGTSIQITLSSLLRDDSTTRDFITNIEAGKQFPNVEVKFLNLKHSIQPNIKVWLEQQNIDYSDWHEFAIIRNPYTRTLSLYNFTLQNKNLGLDLDQFLSQLKWLSKTDSFFKPQCVWVKNPLTAKINLYKFEDIENEWIRLCNEIGLDRCSLSHKNKTNYANQLTDSQKEIIYDIYQDDFKELGYDK